MRPATFVEFNDPELEREQPETQAEVVALPTMKSTFIDPDFERRLAAERIVGSWQRILNVRLDINQVEEHLALLRKWQTQIETVRSPGVYRDSQAANVNKGGDNQ